MQLGELGNCTLSTAIDAQQLQSGLTAVPPPGDAPALAIRVTPEINDEVEWQSSLEEYGYESRRL